ncbi:MAG: ABC transporter permease [Burkholderiales bacterium]|jgi:peptide/nickel transport system permease protein|nr:ABC transporter permease [Burkholderiales bacterium]
MPRLLRILAWRLLQAVPIIVGIAVFNFLLLHLAPGDAADVLAGEAGGATPEYIAELRARFGLDQPLPVQLGRYLANVATLDLGWSFRHQKSVTELIATRLPATLLLMLAAVATAFTLGVVAGVTAARFLRRWPDSLISVLALLAYATPIFWVGLMLILLFSVQLGWLPSGGIETVGADLAGLDRIVDIARHMVLPTLTLALFFLALYARLMRASMLEVYGQDFVTTARAKGLTERRVAYRHVLRNALLPMVTMLGLQIGSLLGGSVLVETVFGWPGLGRLAFEAVFQRDHNLLLGILLLSSLLVVIANVVVDLVYARLDPRIEVA